MSSIEEVGVRIVVGGQAKAKAALGDLKKAYADAAAAAKTSDERIVAANQQVLDSNARVKASRAELGAAQEELAAKIKAANAAINASDAEVAAQASAEVTAQRARIKELQASALAASSARASANAGLTAAKLTAAHEATGKSASKATTAMKGLASIGKVAFLGAGAGAAYLGFEGVKNMASFSDQVMRLHTLAGVPLNALSGLQKWMISSSPGLLEDVGTIADQMYRIASAGSSSGMQMTVKQLQAMTTAAAHLSVLGGPMSDPEQVARVFGVVNAVGGLGMGNNIEKIGETVAATVAATVGHGDMTVQDFIDAVGKHGLGVTASQFKINLTDIGAMLAQLGDQGVSGSLAGSTLQHALTLMGTPVSKKAQTYYGAIGLGNDQVGMTFRTQGGMAGINLLNQHLTGPLDKYLKGDALKAAGEQIGALNSLTPAQIKQLETVGTGGMGDLGKQIYSSLVYSMFGGAKQGAGVLAVLQGAPREQVKKTEIQGSVASYGEKIKDAYNTPAAVFHRWDLDLKQLENDMGVYLIPKLLTIGNWVNKHRSVMVALGIAAGGVVTLGFLAWAGSLSATALAFLGLDVAAAPALGIMALIAVGVAGVTLGIIELYRHWDQIWQWMGDHKRYAAVILIAGLVLAPFLTMPIVLAMIATHWSDFWEDLKKYAGDGVNDIIGIINDFTGLINKALGWAGVHIPQIGKVTWGQAASTVAANPGVSKNNAKMMATGGLITNRPTAIVGEGNPSWPEWVIPTDPAYRKRALGLYESLGTRLMGMGGSIIGKVGGVAKSVVDPFGLGSKAAHAVAGVALDPIKDGALAAAGMLPSGLIRQLADGLINKIFTWAFGMGSGGSAPPAGSASGVAALGKQMAAARGWTGAQWDALNAVAMRESGWNPNAVNKSSGAYGIGQSLGHGHPYNLGDAPAQITWMLDYIAGRYGSPSAAWAHEQNFGWYAKGGPLPVRSYDLGGMLPTGASVAVNGTGRPEPVGHDLGGTTINLTINGSVYGDRKALMTEVQRAVGDAVARRSGVTR